MLSGVLPIWHVGEMVKGIEAMFGFFFPLVLLVKWKDLRRNEQILWVKISLLDWC